MHFSCFVAIQFNTLSINTLMIMYHTMNHYMINSYTEGICIQCISTQKYSNDPDCFYNGQIAWVHSSNPIHRL